MMYTCTCPHEGTSLSSGVQFSLPSILWPPGMPHNWLAPIENPLPLIQSLPAFTITYDWASRKKSTKLDSSPSIDAMFSSILRVWVSVTFSVLKRLPYILAARSLTIFESVARKIRLSDPTLTLAMLTAHNNICSHCSLSLSILATLRFSGCADPANPALTCTATYFFLSKPNRCSDHVWLIGSHQNSL